MWREYSNRFERFSHRLQHLWNEWEELSSSSSGNDAEAKVYSLKVSWGLISKSDE